MALNIDPASIAEALRRNVESWKPTVEREEVGRVTETADGVARVQGLPGAMANELLEFPGGIFGLAFNLDVDEIGCIILGESDKIEEGDAVKQTGTILSMPVGDGFLGRVVDALGRPLDDKGPIPVDRAPQPGGAGAERRLAAAGEGAALHRHLGDRRHDGHRARPAPAAHRRPPDRQDRGRGRRDHRPARALGHRPRGEVHLRGHRSEGVHRVGGGRDAPRERRPRVHGRGERIGRRPRAVPVHRALRGAPRSAPTGCTRATAR